MDCSLQAPSVHGDSPGKNTGVGCHALLQGIFPTQGSNEGLPHCRQILYHLSHQGSPRIQEWVTHPSPENRPDPGIKPRSSALQGNSLPTEPSGKPKNTGVESLSLLRGIFSTQELNQGLLHCRWIFYQFSYQGSPASDLLPVNQRFSGSSPQV